MILQADLNFTNFITKFFCKIYRFFWVGCGGSRGQKRGGRLGGE